MSKYGSSASSMPTPVMSTARWEDPVKFLNLNSYTYGSLGIVIFLVARLFWYGIQGEFGPSPLDELLILYLAPFALFGLGMANRSILSFYSLIWYALFFFMYCLSGLVNEPATGRGFNLFLYGAAGELKWFVFFCAALYFAADEQKIARHLKPILLVLVGIALINSVPVVLDALGSGRSIHGASLIRRGPLWLPHGFFAHQVTSAHVTVFGFIASLCIPAKRPKTMALVRIFLFGLVIAHGVSKEATAVTVVTGLYFFLSPRGLIKRGGILVKAAIFFTICAAIYVTVGEVFLNRISFYTSEEAEGSVRRLLYSASTSIAFDFFPLGTGPSTFASDGARTGLLSTLYGTYGVYGYWGANYLNSNFLVDVFWPKILAEAGAIGAVFYGLFMASPAWSLLRNIRHLNDIGRFCLFVYVSGLISSVGSPALNSEMYAVIFYSAFAIALFPRNILEANAAQPADEPSAERPFNSSLLHVRGQQGRSLIA